MKSQKQIAAEKRVKPLSKSKQKKLEKQRKKEEEERIKKQKKEEKERIKREKQEEKERLKKQKKDEEQRKKEEKERLKAEKKKKKGTLTNSQHAEVESKPLIPGYIQGMIVKCISNMRSQWNNVRSFRIGCKGLIWSIWRDCESQSMETQSSISRIYCIYMVHRL